MATHGLKCACGREITDERVEEALTITAAGRGLLDKSRWLSLLVMAELMTLEIPADSILLEQSSGGDEMDCFADISGEMTFFELKDKEFSLGNAYSFGAKIGIFRPEHSVIVTSAYVGNDAKQHFQRAEESAVQDPYALYVAGRSPEPNRVVYIEGIENLRSDLEALVGRIFAKDAAGILDRILPRASLDAESLVDALGQKSALPHAPAGEPRP
jgi:hypothetical protein